MMGSLQCLAQIIKDPISHAKKVQFYLIGNSETVKTENER